MTLYKREEKGKSVRYIPFGESVGEDFLHAFQHGYYILKVEPGLVGVAAIEKTKPFHIAAALEDAKNAMIDAGLEMEKPYSMHDLVVRMLDEVWIRADQDFGNSISDVIDILTDLQDSWSRGYSVDRSSIEEAARKIICKLHGGEK